MIDFLQGNILFWVLVGSIIFDIILGIIKSIVKQDLSSTINKQGITKHIEIILLVIFCALLFYILDINDLTDILIMFYIGSYLLSIVENLDSAGVPIPHWLIDKFDDIRGEQ